MHEPLYIATLTSPLGDMRCGTYQEKLVLLTFGSGEKEIEQMAGILKTTIEETPSELSKQVQKQLSAYFEQKRQSFDLPLLLLGSDFQVSVWESLYQIPYGQTISYQQQAVRHGDLKAIRAIAKANGDNHIGIVVPCHRVIGSNGDLTGYAGEIWRKKALLELEGAIGQQKSLF